MQDFNNLRSQVKEQRRKVDFDSYDLSCEELVRRIQAKRIDISPEYQRQFRWDEERQSALIESLLLGIPVPNLFMATNSNPDMPSTWEVVDGLQRSLTIANFILGAEEERSELNLKSRALSLKGLTKLTELEGLTFEDLPDDIKTTFLDRPIKVTVLNDKSDKQVRFDLFERLNTGGIALTAQEVRECVYAGPMLSLIDELSSEKHFRKVALFNSGQRSSGAPEEYVLRFFALSDRYEKFDHSVKTFLNEYIDWANTHLSSKDIEDRRKAFIEVFEYLSKVFPDGIKRKNNVTPANLFEGISVGAYLALKENPDIPVMEDCSWTLSDEYSELTSSGTNSRVKVKGRINFARDKFLGNA